MLIPGGQTNYLCFCLCHDYTWNTNSFTGCCSTITPGMPRPQTSTVSPPVFPMQRCVTMKISVTNGKDIYGIHLFMVLFNNYKLFAL
jgi:hypothetical protein